MRRPALLLLLLGLAARAQPSPLTLHFEQGLGGLQKGGLPGEARIELGEIFNAKGSPRLVHRTVVRIRITSGSPTTRFVRLSAHLQSDSRYPVRVNGLLLSAAPQLIDPQAPVGPAQAHTIEIEIPKSEPAGELLAPIVWVAESVD